MFLGSPLIPHLVGRSFAESSLALRWLCLLPLFRSIHWSAGDALTGAGYQKVRLSTQAGAAAFNFALNVYLIPRYGWFGAAWSSLATDGALGAVNWMVILGIRTRVKLTAQPLQVAGEIHEPLGFDFAPSCGKAASILPRILSSDPSDPICSAILVGQQVLARFGHFRRWPCRVIDYPRNQD